jgi:hypothetical protein
MGVIYAILAVTGWIWVGVVAVFLYRRLRKPATDPLTAQPAAKHDQ